MNRNVWSPKRQRGLVLISSLLLLLVVTIIAVSIFRSFGMQEKIAGNVREKQRALNAAESALHYAEWWLSTNVTTSTVAVSCSGLVNGNLSSQVLVCSNGLATPTSMPWKDSGADVGFTYTPPAMTVSNSVNSYGTSYYDNPRFYITDIGKSAGVGEVYKVTAAGYGATTNAVAVVESTYSVYVSSWDTTL